MIPLAVAGFLVLTMFCAYHIGGSWPHDLRDRYLRMVGVLATALTLGLVEPGLGVLLALAVYRWRSPETLAPVLVFSTGAGLYALVRFGGADTHAACQAVIVAIAMIQTGWGAFDLGWRGLYKLRLTLHQARDFPRASMGNRLFIGAMCALAAPLAPLWALPVLVAGLILTNTYTAVAAAGVGLAVAHPAWTPWLLGLAAVTAPFIVWWRGHPRDSWAGRVTTWRLGGAALLASGWHIRLFGFGHGSFLSLARWWSARQWTGQHYRQAHNDLVQVTVEWGLLGLAGTLLWVGAVAREMTLGDPVSGAMTAAFVLTLGAFPSYLPQTAVPMLCLAAILRAP